MLFRSSRMLAVYEKTLDGIGNSRKRNIDGQISLFIDFENVQDINIKIQYPAIKEFEKKYILAMEKEMTGLYLSGHPLEEYEQTLKLQTSIKISDILSNEMLDEGLIQESKVKDGDTVILGGLVTEITKKVTKNNDIMAFAKLEDLYGAIEVVIFPKVLQRFRDLVSEDSMVIIRGRVNIREDEQPKVLCEVIEPLIKINTEKLYILIEEEKFLKNTLNDLKSMISSFKGVTPVYLCTRKERKKFRVDRELWVDNDLELMSTLKSKFGEENVKIM